MTEQVQAQDPQNKNTAKAVNRWNNISSDEDEESESEQSEKQEQKVSKAKVEPNADVVVQAPKQEVKRKEHNIVPFDPKKKFRGDFAHIKTVKGGFKAEKLEQKKFQLDTIKNPFAVDDSSSEEEDVNDEKTADGVSKEAQAEKAAEASPQQSAPEPKKIKKSKKQQQKQELDALLKELGQESGNKQEGKDGEAKKKKKAKKAKKADVEQKEGQKPEQEKKDPEPTQQFAVDRDQLEEVMRKKAAESVKTTGKKGTGKGAVASNAKRAIEEREAKNKGKKIYVDL